ncbi:MAG: hypothetical protein JWO35_783 [Candidatus Saccharibacteria bacterium]|nr:hypothetical protein [Candidatus Saccharibacteria bacterium]
MKCMNREEYKKSFRSWAKALVWQVVALIVTLALSELSKPDSYAPAVGIVAVLFGFITFSLLALMVISVVMLIIRAMQYRGLL